MNNLPIPYTYMAIYYIMARSFKSLGIRSILFKLRKIPIEHKLLKSLFFLDFQFHNNLNFKRS